MMSAPARRIVTSASSNADSSSSTPACAAGPVERHAVARHQRITRILAFGDCCQLQPVW